MNSYIDKNHVRRDSDHHRQEPYKFIGILSIMFKSLTCARTRHMCGPGAPTLESGRRGSGWPEVAPRQSSPAWSAQTVQPHTCWQRGHDPPSLLRTARAVGRPQCIACRRWRLPAGLAVAAGSCAWRVAPAHVHNRTRLGMSGMVGAMGGKRRWPTCAANADGQHAWQRSLANGEGRWPT